MIAIVLCLELKMWMKAWRMTVRTAIELQWGFRPGCIKQAKLNVHCFDYLSVVNMQITLQKGDACYRSTQFARKIRQGFPSEDMEWMSDNYCVI